jgi:hypothetical protein
MFLNGAVSSELGFVGWTRASLIGLAFGLMTGCGSRSSLKEGVDEGPEPECIIPDDCDQSDLCQTQTCAEGVCVALDPVVCASPDLCHTSICDPLSGQCVVEALTSDLDGDGFPAPRLGTLAGAPNSCGNDCDDASPLAFPGGIEVCDGVDNDCDGVVDNGSNYLESPDGRPPRALAVASGFEGSGRRGAAFGDGTFVLGYWGRDDLTLSYLRGLTVDGEEVFAQTPVTNVNAPSFGPDVAWTGNTFAALWSDARVDDNYEIYFARYNALGEKLGPDLRLTDSPDFSIHPWTLFDQGRFVVVWDDRRNESSVGGPQIFAQLVSEQGELVGENRLLTGDLEVAEYPATAATPERLGLVYTSLVGDAVSLRFRTFDKEFGDASEALVLARTDARAPRVTAVGDLFIVSWDDYGIAPGESIMAAVVSQQGQLLLNPQPITSGASFARSHDTISLGDRLVLLWVDDMDGNYELYAKVLASDLTEIEPRYRMTQDDADTLGPLAVLGESGRLGVLFDDWRSGTHHTYFTTIGCGNTQSLR